MTSAFATSGIAGTTYKALFRKQILRARPRVVGMAVAYVSATGFSLVKSILDEGRVDEVRLVTGISDAVTHPRALRNAVDNGWNVRIANTPDRTFHPKLYVGAARFDDEAGVSDVSLAIAGSANISHAGFLTNGECVFWSAAPQHRRSAGQAWRECWNAGVEATAERIQAYEEVFAQRNRQRRSSDLVVLGIADNFPDKTDGTPTRGIRGPRPEHRAISEATASAAWAGLESFTGERRLQVEFPRVAGEVLARILLDFSDDDSVEILCADGERREFMYKY